MRITFTFLLITFSQLTFSQTITIINTETNEPIENLTLVGDNEKTRLTTDQNGRVDISQLNTEKHILIYEDSYFIQTISYEELKSQRKIHISTNSFELEEVVISPSKWVQQIKKTPNKVVPILHGEYELQNSQTVADLLGSSSAEVFIQKSQLGGGSPMIRGFATNRVLITVDGIRMNNAIFRSGNVQNVIAIDPNAVEKTEISLGSNSLIYGSDAIGGVMSFHTYNPEFLKEKKFQISGDVFSRYSTANNEHTVHTGIKLRSKKISSYTGFTYTQFSDLTMGKHGPDEYLRNHYVERVDGQDSMLVNTDNRKQIETGYKQYNFTQKLGVKLDDDLILNYGLHYSKTSNVPRYDRLIRYRDDNLRSAEWYYGPQTWLMNHLSLEKRNAFGIFSEAKLNLAHQFFEESRNDRNFNSVEKTQQTEKVNVYSVNVDFLKNLNTKSKIYYGIEALFNKVNSTGEILNIETLEKIPTNSRYPDNSTWNSYSGYLMYNHFVSSKVNLQGGVRYNYVESKSKFTDTFFDFPFTNADFSTGALTGSLGLSYNPNLNTNIKLNLSTAFRAPNIDDVGKVFDSEPGSVVIPNPDVKSEYAYNAEVGVSHNFNDIFQVDLTAYYIKLKDALVRRNYMLDGQDSILYQGEMSQVQAIQNAANAYSYGVELNMNLRLSRSLQLKAAANYQKGREELDDGTEANLRHIAPLLVRGGFLFKKKNFQTYLYANYNAEISNEDLAPSEQGKDYMYAIDENGNPYSPSWYTLNIKTNYQLNKNLSIATGWENITNQRYRPYSSGIVAAGSNLILSVNLHF